MKNRIYLLLSSVLFLLGACTPKQDTVTYVIASETVDCDGVGKQKCLLVKKGDATDWEYFYSPIEGFNHENGYEYVLRVKEEKVDNPPADASSIRYTLVKEISKTAKTSEYIPEPAFSQDEYQWGGKVLAIEEGTIGRGAAEGQFPVKTVTIVVSHSATDLFHGGDTIHAEILTSPQVVPVVGREYIFKASDSHPAHAKGIYMLNTNVMDLV